MSARKLLRPSRTFWILHRSHDLVNANIFAAMVDPTLLVVQNQREDCSGTAWPVSAHHADAIKFHLYPRPVLRIESASPGMDAIGRTRVARRGGSARAKLQPPWGQTPRPRVGRGSWRRLLDPRCRLHSETSGSANLPSLCSAQQLITRRGSWPCEGRCCLPSIQRLLSRLT